jgi:hypothetical protein
MKLCIIWYKIVSKERFQNLRPTIQYYHQIVYSAGGGGGGVKLIYHIPARMATKKI